MMLVIGERSFTVLVERDDESGGYVGEIPALPGCYTQGADLGSLRLNLLEAIEVYLETVEDGRSDVAIPSPLVPPKEDRGVEGRGGAA